MAPDQAPALQVQGLGFAAGGVSVLSGVDLAVADGEFLGIIGPNGAGKTTLFNLLSGLLRGELTYLVRISYITSHISYLTPVSQYLTLAQAQCTSTRSGLIPVALAPSALLRDCSP